MINYLTETDLINGIKITPDSLILGDCLEVMKHIPKSYSFCKLKHWCIKITSEKEIIDE